MNKTDAVAYFGASMKNTRWSWGGMSADGRTVVLCCWHNAFIRDPFGDGAGQVTYNFGPLDRSEPNHDLGFRDFVGLVRHAIDNCGGIVRASVIWARDFDDHPHEVVKSEPLKGYALQIVHFDPETAHLVAKRILLADPRVEAVSNTAAA
jgi:hypothetical protein